jgi:transposase-like protein
MTFQRRNAKVARQVADQIIRKVVQPSPIRCALNWATALEEHAIEESWRLRRLSITVGGKWLFS